MVLPTVSVGEARAPVRRATLAAFEQYVAQGRIHYFMGEGCGLGGGSGTSSEIAQWVAHHFTFTTVDGVTVYDLTRPAA